ncbi:MAG TPA: ParB/RepB/Spo0J family partition protein, partial [Arthrobacter sp.]|nr:ParB/RepB/Spo0J family partition protein [Arthrobacter sp.]
MSDKRRGLGRGLGALIPSSAAASGNGSAPSRPVDLFFPEARKRTPAAEASAAVDPVVAPDEEAAAESLAPSANKAPAAASDVPEPKTAAVAKKAPARKAPASKAATPAAGPKTAASVPAAEEVVVVPDAEDQGVELVEVPGVRFAEIPVTDIHPNRKQPRSVFDEDDMAELVHSVREIGVLQPIVVRTSTGEGGEPYELVMGERRWRAVQAAGLETIPAIVRDTTDDDLLRDALLENLHRSQLNPLEEAAAYQQLLEDFGTTHEQLADRIGRSRPQVSNTLRLLKLPPLVQRRV